MQEQRQLTFGKLALHATNAVVIIGVMSAAYMIATKERLPEPLVFLSFVWPIILIGNLGRVIYNLGRNWK